MHYANKLAVLDDIGFVELVDTMPVTARFDDQWGSGDARVVEAARVSYKKRATPPTTDQNKRLLAYLLKNQHWSPFEQVKLTYRIRLPIFVARQIMRHRTIAFNEISARYAEMDDKFYVPCTWRMATQATDNKQASGELLDTALAVVCRQHYEEAYESAMASYRALLEEGLARELARAVLPVGLYTELFCSVDLRNLLHFVALRDHDHAQWETRQYAIALAKLAANVAPWTMKIFKENNT